MSRFLVVMLLCLVCAPVALAGECPAFLDASPTVAAREGSDRLEYLHATLQPARRKARRWYLGWSIGFASLAAVQAASLPILAPTVEDKRARYVGMAASGIGAILVAATPPPQLRHGRLLAARIVAGGEDICALLADAEEMLLVEVAAERFGTSWLMHAGNLLYNVAAGLLLGLAWGQWTDAYLTTAVGVLLGEAMLWTRPLDRTRDLEHYRRGTWTVPTARRPTLRPAPLALQGGAGLALNGT